MSLPIKWTIFESLIKSLKSIFLLSHQFFIDDRYPIGASNQTYKYFESSFGILKPKYGSSLEISQSFKPESNHSLSFSLIGSWFEISETVSLRNSLKLLSLKK